MDIHIYDFSAIFANHRHFIFPKLLDAISLHVFVDTFY